MKKTCLMKPMSLMLLGLFTTCYGWAQDPNQAPPAEQQPPPQYPPQGQNPYPQTQGQPPQSAYPSSGQYPPPGQYPQYPQQQGQYPPQQQGQYPPPQSQQQGPYPQYPAGQYPPQQYPAPPSLAPQQLDQLVAPIALYPDGLLAQVLTASTYANEIPDAAAWANAHQYMRGDQLAQAIRSDSLNFDPSVMALLPFPNVLNYMAQYMGWTQALGNAVLAQRDQVMDATQRLRQEAYEYGYLRTNQYVRVIANPGWIEVVPANPSLYYVPYYNPGVVFARPRPGFYAGAAIRFGPALTIGAAFSPWGWGSAGFGWRDHTILIDNRPWARTWANRGVYAHPYAEPYHADRPRVEHHDVHGDRGDHGDRDHHR